MKKLVELNETVDLMLSADYEERFRAEYWQLRIRYEKLNMMLYKWDKGTLEFTPSVPREVYDRQVKIMRDYLELLFERASIEDIRL